MTVNAVSSSLFVWGRARVPLEDDWPTKFKIDRAGHSEDKLPYSHTCFFSVELPAYSSDEVMRRRLLAVIHFGLGGMLNG